jgi:hypothetical protein
LLIITNKRIDAELCEELFDCALHNLMMSKEFVKDPRNMTMVGNTGPNQKWTKLYGLVPAKNKFMNHIRTTPTKNMNRNSPGVNLDDIDLKLINSRKSIGNPFDDLKYALNDSKFLFYHWERYKDKREDIEDYMRYGAGNQIDYFVWLLR